MARLSGRARKAWLLGLFTAVLLLSLPALLSLLVKDVLLPRTGERLGLSLSAEDVKVRPTRVFLHRLRMAPAGGGAELLRAPLAEVRFSPWSLFALRVRLSEVRVERPVIQVLHGEGVEDNITQVLGRLRGGRAAGGAGGGAGGGPQRLLVTAGAIDVRDPTGSLRVGALDADLREGQPSKVVCQDLEAELVGGATAKAGRVVLRFVPRRFMPAGIPEVEIDGGALLPWRRFALTGVRGSLRPDGADAARAVISLLGGYGGVDRVLWEASGWIRPGSESHEAVGREKALAATEAQLSVRAARFALSSLDPILRGTPVIDTERGEVDAQLDLHYADQRLDFDGSFHMSGLSLESKELSQEPVRGLGFDITARGRIDPRARRFQLSQSVIKWRGAEARIEIDAEAQPAHLRVIRATLPDGTVQGPSWRDRWRNVSMHLVIPPVPCQSLLNSLPPALVPRLQGFKLTGTFSTDIGVQVDFAQLLKLPPPPKDDLEEEMAALSDSPEPQVAAESPPVMTKQRHRRLRRGRRPEEMPPLRMPGGAAVGLSPSAPSPAGPSPVYNGKNYSPKNGPQAVTLWGKVGIDGCQVEEAPAEMDAERLMLSFEHQVEVEPGQVLSFAIGPENQDFVPYEDISPYLINSIMTTEDNGFFRHRGFIQREFRTALEQNLQRGYFRLGASSITMQLVKNVLLSREKTLSRKFQELFLTWYLEQNLTKERILEIYFNAIEFGPYIYGIGRAVRHYFGKSPRELTPREAAWFSSILPSPKRRYVHFCKGKPDAKWEAYLSRILRRVHERGRLTDEEFQAAMEERFTFNREDALPEKDCLNLVKRMTTPLPDPAAPEGEGATAPDAKRLQRQVHPPQMHKVNAVPVQAQSR